jgi:hypothetical protein
VTLALGLLACVLGSVAGLFVIGAGQVKSGRGASVALAAARSITEEMQGWGHEQLYSTFGLDGCAPSYVVDTRSYAAAAAWQADLSEALPGGYATIAIASLEPGSPDLDESSQVRLMITVHWSEGQRERKVRVGSVKM